MCFFSVSQEDSLVLIIAIAVSVIVVVLLICIVCLCRYRKYTNNKPTSNENKQNDETKGDKDVSRPLLDENTDSTSNAGSKTDEHLPKRPVEETKMTFESEIPLKGNLEPTAPPESLDDQTNNNQPEKNNCGRLKLT